MSRVVPSSPHLLSRDRFELGMRRRLGNGITYLEPNPLDTSTNRSLRPQDTPYPVIPFDFGLTRIIGSLSSTYPTLGTYCSPKTTSLQESKWGSRPVDRF